MAELINRTRILKGYGKCFNDALDSLENRIEELETAFHPEHRILSISSPTHCMLTFNSPLGPLLRKPPYYDVHYLVVSVMFG